MDLYTRLSYRGARHPNACKSSPGDVCDYWLDQRLLKSSPALIAEYSHILFFLLK